MYVYYYRSSLRHHGIKGQEWGVRRGPPYPIEDKTTAKGTRLNRVSNSKKGMRSSPIYAYNPNDEWDSKVYKGAFAIFKSQNGRKPLYERSYEVTKELKMPTKQERIDEFINIYKDKSIPTGKELTDYRSLLLAYGLRLTDRTKDIDYNNLKTKDDFKAGYDMFNRAMEYADKFASTKKYMEIMSQKYDAMVDDNNVNVYNNVHDSMIIFRPNEVLKEVKKARKVKVSEMNKNLNYVRKELSKEGKQVAF